MAVLSKPVTKLGHSKMADEHEFLARTERPKVLEGIQIAAAEGDRSENAEYIYGRKRLRELDRRLRYLDALLKDTQIIDQDKISGERVIFGSTVVVLTEQGEKKKYTIVGEGETEFHQSAVSWKSPVAKALLGKKVGDSVTIYRPAGDIEVEIEELIFGTFEA
ncbi:MAG: GreA/GreB family elongation factor [Pseudomonadota bacterium]